MPLTSPPIPGDVIEVGALTPTLFNFTSGTAVADLNALVQKAIDRADAWLAGHAGDNYNLQTPFWAPILQKEGVIYLAMERLVDILKSEKVYGTHAPYMSEDSASYTSLLETDWYARAMASLDLWVTVESATGGAGGSAGFALPYFGISTSTPIVEDANNGLDPLVVLYEEILARSRGLSNNFPGVVVR